MNEQPKKLRALPVGIGASSSIAVFAGAWIAQQLTIPEYTTEVTAIITAIIGMIAGMLKPHHD